MFKQYVSLVPLALLFGCANPKAQQQHQAVMQQLTNIESAQREYSESTQSSLEKQHSQLLVLTKKFKEQAKTIESIQRQLESKQASENALETVAQDALPAHEQIVLGEIERVSIDSVKEQFDARVDTGAATSSLNALDINEFERDGDKWVRFHLADTAEDGSEKQNNDKEKHWIEAPVTRYVQIRQSTQSESERRIVVELPVTLGPLKENAQFTLADRTQMTHPILLGREFIKDIALVDVSQQFLMSKETETKSQ